MLLLLLIEFLVSKQLQSDEKENKTKNLWEAFSKTLQESGKLFWNQIQYLKHLNIIIIGKTGAGKSKLLNSIFECSYAEDDVGKPVTKTIQKYKNKNYPLTLYDTPGLEIKEKKQKQLKKDLSNLIQKKFKTNDKKKFIHCIWYCIQCGSSRIEEEEIKFLKELSTQYSYEIPIIIILTQCYNENDKKKMIEALEKENLKIPIVPVVAAEKEFGSFIIPSFGLEQLILTMKDCLSSIIYHAQSNGNIVSIKKSKKLSYLPISVGGSSALFVGYFPIKSGKATAIGLINILMIKKIADIYGIPVLGDTVSDIFQNTFKECFFSTDESFEMQENLINLLTLFKAGGVVSGVSAAAVTASIGLAYSYIAEYRCKSIVDPKLVSYKDFQKQINNIFNNNLNEEESKIFKKFKQ